MGVRCPCPRARRAALVACALLLCLLGSAGADARASRASRGAAHKAHKAHPARRHAAPKRRICKTVIRRRHKRGRVCRAAKKPLRHPRRPVSAAAAKAAAKAAAPAPQAGGRYIDPSFFGQHLENFPSWPGILAPPWAVKTIRLWDAGVAWCELEPTPGQYDWATLDSWLDYAAATGADLVYTFGDTPGWAVPGGQGGCSSSEQNQAPDPSAWQGFVSALVQHAAGRIKYFELWNEWDYNYFWSGGVTAMVDMAEQAAAIIHGAHQGLMVLTPSVTPYDGNGALESFLHAVPPTSGTIDVVAVHTYTQSSQGEGLWPEDTLYGWIGKVRAAMQGAGYAGYPLWSTEGGWGANSWFSGYADPAGQRAFVARYDLALLSLGLDRAYWYAYGNPAWDTLWTSNGLTPAGTATQTLLGWLSGATLAAPCSEDDTGLWACDITRPGGYRARIEWVQSGIRTVPVPSGYTTLRTLSGESEPAPRTTTVSIEPVLVES